MFSLAFLGLVSPCVARLNPARSCPLSTTVEAKFAPTKNHKLGIILVTTLSDRLSTGCNLWLLVDAAGVEPASDSVADNH
jgi:hypothetical protein